MLEIKWCPLYIKKAQCVEYTISISGMEDFSPFLTKNMKKYLLCKTFRAIVNLLLIKISAFVSCAPLLGQ